MATPLLVVDHQPYADAKDHRLAVMLAEEGAAEELGLTPLDRLSCRASLTAAQGFFSGFQTSSAA
jgi:hypothetical protein